MINNVADMMTKPLGSTKLTKHREEAGLIQQGGDMKNSKIEGVC
jgi:hypothetical protein